MNEVLMFIFFIASLILLLVSVGYLFLSFRKPSATLECPDPSEKAIALIEDARMSAMRIVKEANYKALNTMQSANTFNKESKHELEDSLEHLTHTQLEEFEKLSQSLLDTYRQSMTKQEEEGQAAIREVSSELKSSVLQEVKEFTEALQKETLESQSIAEQQIKKEYENIRKELDDYKALQYKKIDENIYKIVTKATQKILGRAISVSDHEDIVLASLEEAKKQGVFE